MEEVKTAPVHVCNFELKSCSSSWRRASSDLGYCFNKYCGFRSVIKATRVSNEKKRRLFDLRVGELEELRSSWNSEIY